MRRNGEIVVIEDDEDDRMLLKDIFESLGYANKIVFIEDPSRAVEYLSNPNVNPFIVISDINMPKIDGFTLRSQILADQELSMKCIPYIFLSTSKTPENVFKAYQYNVQGYFKKEYDFNVFKQMIQRIIEYWSTGVTPTNSF
ncbi:response regulator [Flavobacterium sp. ACN6]|uniref:response regulator n=1 Tax=Flavobacterium sp. ACN6 TaxID=1920426 RepID=UPI000BB36646|nr:response regulator [Flavobacterium sp. ACN6]PBJ05627.1 Response regulator rcp1 [Flavobacterium sp. ACN6]